MILKSSKIYVAGHRGMVGSAIMRNLKSKGYDNIISRTHAELDLTNQKGVKDFFDIEKPEYVIIAAAKVGGILANSTYGADFIYQNLMIEANLIHQSFLNGVEKVLFLGSSCIYPKYAEQPMKEEALLTGSLEQTNEPYAIAKIAGIKLCESYYKQHHSNFISIMPTNLYGPYDNFDLTSSHVMPALIRKFDEAKRSHSPVVEIWGTGTPLREFLHVDDMAEASVFCLENVQAKDLYGNGISHLNVGTGEDLTIKELVSIIKKTVCYEGEAVYDSSKPDGTPKKLMDVSRLADLGWKYKINLKEGIQSTYQWYLDNYVY